MIKFNGAFLRPHVPRPIPIRLQESKAVNLKYVDDGSVAVSVNLETHLKNDHEPQLPPSFHQRTGHILPDENNLLQCYVLDTEKFASENNMMINKSKTDIIMFTNSRKFDFQPEIKFKDGTLLELKSEKKLLGVIISEDLKWRKNTAYLVAKVRQKIWLIQRALPLHFSTSELFDIYSKEVRSILEYAIPV